MITQYKKVKCDNIHCGKEVEMKEDYTFPHGWLQIEIFEWEGSSGHGVFDKTVCSKNCVIAVLRAIKNVEDITSKRPALIT